MLNTRLQRLIDEALEKLSSNSLTSIDLEELFIIASKDAYKNANANRVFHDQVFRIVNKLEHTTPDLLGGLNWSKISKALRLSHVWYSNSCWNPDSDSGREITEGYTKLISSFIRNEPDEFKRYAKKIAKEKEGYDASWLKRRFVGAHNFDNVSVAPLIIAKTINPTLAHDIAKAFLDNFSPKGWLSKKRSRNTETRAIVANFPEFAEDF